MNKEILELLTGIGAIFTGFAWIVNQLTKLREDNARHMGELQKALNQLAVNAEKHVTYAVCSEHRKNCPCVKDIEKIKEKLDAKFGK